jgi:hypothetical protein
MLLTTCWCTRIELQPKCIPCPVIARTLLACSPLRLPRSRAASPFEAIIHHKRFRKGKAVLFCCLLILRFSLEQSVFGHACILFARVPALCERRALPADAATLRVMLRLIYTLELPPSLSQSVLTTLIALCHELAAWRLKERCEEELVVLLNEDNVVTLFKWVCTNKKMQMGRLASACIKMIVASFETLRGRLKELPDEYYVAVKTLARKKNEKQ